MKITASLLERYDRPGPRYTSYPTAPWFHDGWTGENHRERLGRHDPSAPISLYVHIPFCEARCRFCGCNMIAAPHRDAAPIDDYLNHLLREAELVAEALPRERRCVQLHWGGGTPTYLSGGQIERLFSGLVARFPLGGDAEVSIEADPVVTTKEHLHVLRNLGFNRISFGVQDFTPEVQEAIDRIQTVEKTGELIEAARVLGFDGINVDLVYGLPRQRRQTFSETVRAVVDMQVDRLAVYSFAYLPQMKAHQRRLNPDELPDREAKFGLYLEAKERLEEAGYLNIGMDHFALPHDELYRAFAEGSLHRNFMGYTTRPATDLVGLGITAISDVCGSYAQNEKKLSRYGRALSQDRLPVQRGCALDREDELRRFVITRLMTAFRVTGSEIEERFHVSLEEQFATELEELRKPAWGELVEPREGVIEVTELGHLFVRNVAMVFDAYLEPSGGKAGCAGDGGGLDGRHPIFSRTI